MPTAIISKGNISPHGGFETEADFNLIHQLLKNPRYVIPERLREKAIRCIESCIDGEEVADQTKLAAIRTALDMDKINLEMIKIAMPKKVETRDITKATDEELTDLVREVLKRCPTTLETPSLTQKD